LILYRGVDRARAVPSRSSRAAMAGSVGRLGAAFVTVKVQLSQGKGGYSMSRPFRGTASFGKRREFAAIARLLEEGFDVYQPLIDDQQIDCIIRLESDGKPYYRDIQIKARSGSAGKESHGHWSSVKIRPRPNYFFIFYSEPLETYWVIPSTVLAKKARQVPSRQGTDLYEVTLEHRRKDKASDEHPDRKPEKFKKYVDAFHLLRKAKRAPRR
jgi:hypothetical protein